MGKVCTKCGMEKEESEFELRKDTNKLRNSCKQCEKDKRKKDHEDSKLKKCKTCKTVKPQSEFSKDGNRLRCSCKQCEKVKHLKYYINNRDKILANKSIYYKENENKIKAKNKEWYEDNKESQNKYAANWRIENSDHIKEYRLKNKETINEKLREYAKTPRGREIRRKSWLKWSRTSKGKLWNKKRKADRRNLGFNSINEYFENSEYHHLRYTNTEIKDNDIGIHVPKELHQSIRHNGITGKNMALANKKFLEWYLNNTPAEERNKQAIKLYWNYCTLPEPVWDT